MAVISQLQGGGTNAMRQGKNDLMSAIQAAQQQAQAYSVDAARQQAQQSQALYMQQFMEGSMSQINAAMEAAGMSGDSMGALLAQDAAARSAAQAAANEAAVINQYGQLSQNAIALQLEGAGGLTNDPAMAALLQALDIAKGAVSYTDETGTRTGTSTTNRNFTGKDTGVTLQADMDEKGKLYSPGSGGTRGGIGSRSGSGADRQQLALQREAMDLEYLKTFESMANTLGFSMMGASVVKNDPLHGQNNSMWPGLGSDKMIDYGVPGLQDMLRNWRFR
jgi:hypothetical protein